MYKKRTRLQVKNQSLRRLMVKAAALVACSLALSQAAAQAIIDPAAPRYVDILEWRDSFKEDTTIVVECSDGTRVSAPIPKSELKRISIRELSKRLDRLCGAKDI